MASDTTNTVTAAGVAVPGLQPRRHYLTPVYPTSAASVSRSAAVIWCMSIVLLFFGWRGLVWALPPILFLLFMIPLPFQLERLMSVVNDL